MPITLGQLTANRKPLTVDFGGDAITIDYYPLRLTAEMLVEFATADKVQDMPGDRALAVITSPGAALLHLLAGWDLVESIDEDGTPGPVLPVCEETIGQLGLVLQWALLSAIMADTGNQGKATAPESSAKKRHSGAGSSRTAR